VVVRPLPTQPSDDARDGMARVPTGSRGPLIHVTTRCASLEEFVEKFSGFASEGALVLPAAGELPIGTEARFVIRLADRSVAMRGRCRVMDVKTEPATSGPRRTLLRVALGDLEEASRNVHDRLLAPRSAMVSRSVAASESEPTIVSPSGPVPPPPLRAPPPPPFAARARTMTMIGLQPEPPPAPGERPPAPLPLSRPARTIPRPLARPLGPSTTGVAPGAASIASKAGAPPPTESRVPGAALTLPANPLSAQSPADLASFIDSTLFETEDDHEATAERATPPLIDLPIEEVVADRAAPSAVAAAVDRTSRFDAGTAARAWRLAVGAMPYAICLVVGVLIGRVWRAPRSIPGAVSPAGAFVQAPPPTTAAPAAEAPAAAPVTPTKPGVPSAGGPTEAPGSPANPSAGATTEGHTATPASPPTTAVRAMPAEPTRGPASPASPMSTAEPVRPEPAPAPAVRTAAAPAIGTAPAPAVGAAPAPAVATAAVGAAPAPAVATAAVGTAPEGSAAPGRCTARIVTEPADARIVWGGKPLGQSPIEAARIPCGAATVVIEHERYQSVTREVTADAEAAVVVSQRLHRPAGTLIVNSSPPRAYVTVNDQMLGAAPRRLASSRFEQVSIRATFPGYLPWTKKIYLKEPTTTITAQLVPTGSGGDASRHPAGTR
jgi:hypothetical protein